MFNWCFVTLLIWLPAFLHKQKTDAWMLGENHSTDDWKGCISLFLFLAFLIYALKEKSLFYDEIWWKKYLNVFLVLLRSLSLLPLFSSGLVFLSTATSTSACDCTPSPEVLLDCSLTFCSLNECLNALRSTSFHLEDIFQMLGLEHGELDDKHLIVGNKNFSWSTRPHPYATLAPPPYVIDTPIIDGGPPL